MSRRLRNTIASLTAFIVLGLGYSNCSRGGFHVADMTFQLDSQSTGLDPVYMEGTKLYAQHCALCHNSLEKSLKQDRSAEQIQASISSVPSMASNPALRALTSDQIKAIAQALKTTVAGVDANPFFCQASARPTPHRLQRLAKSEYVNSIRDLFAGVVSLSELTNEIAFFPEELNSDVPFDRGADSMSLGLVQAHDKISTRVASLVTSSTTKLNQIFSETCFTSGTVDDACLNSFIDRFGSRVYRRPVKTSERAPLIAAYRLGSSRIESSALMLRALLMSPNFLYHLEFDGTPIDSEMSGLKLNAYELASRLSYMIVNTTPDTQLLAAAADGSLLTTATFDAQLRRLLAMPAAKSSLRRFFYLWFELNHMRDPVYTANFKNGINTTNINAEALEEALLFIDHVVFEGKKLESLLTDTTAFIRSAELAKIYGITLPSNADGRTTLPSNERAGLLTRAVRTLAGNDTTSPIHRGVSVRRSLLCESLASPNPDTLPPGSLNPPPEDPTLSTRTRFENKTSAPMCMGCHGQINPIGYALENYDALGRYRKIESIFNSSGALIAEHPINAVATINLSAPPDPSVNGGLELSSKIAESQKFAACFSKKIFQFTFRRSSTALDNCVLAATYDSLKAPNATLLESIKSLVLNPEFQIRRMR